ncbi:MAG: hypothetical protein Q9224_002472 [Gallowayella concinna]
MKGSRHLRFCDQHDLDSHEDKEAWRLQRDITHALIVPVLEIYRHATQVAKALLGNRHIFDLELVFRGEARGAFSWLQCFVTEEEDWCLTRGCPGCVVTHALVAEPTIRLILVACHLSSTLSNTSTLHHQPQHGHTSPPLLDFWQHSLKKALDEDPFWGPDLWRTFESRAKALERGIEELVQQCIEFASLALANAAVGNHNDDESPPQSPKSTVLKMPQGGMKEQNQKNWIPSVVLGCWTTLLADAEEAKRCVAPSNGTTAFEGTVHSGVLVLVGEAQRSGPQSRQGAYGIVLERGVLGRLVIGRNIPQDLAFGGGKDMLCGVMGWA